MLVRIAWAAAWRGGFGCSSCVSELEEVKAAEMPLCLPWAGLLCSPLKQKPGWAGVQWSQAGAAAPHTWQQQQQGLCSCRNHKTPE